MNVGVVTTAVVLNHGVATHFCVASFLIHLIWHLFYKRVVRILDVSHNFSFSKCVSPPKKGWEPLHYRESQLVLRQRYKDFCCSTGSEVKGPKKFPIHQKPKMKAAFRSMKMVR